MFTSAYSPSPRFSNNAANPLKISQGNPPDSHMCESNLGPRWGGFSVRNRNRDFSAGCSRHYNGQRLTLRYLRAESERTVFLWVLRVLGYFGDFVQIYMQTIKICPGFQVPRSCEQEKRKSGKMGARDRLPIRHVCLSSGLPMSCTWRWKVESGKAGKREMGGWLNAPVHVPFAFHIFSPLIFHSHFDCRRALFPQTEDFSSLCSHPQWKNIFNLLILYFYIRYMFFHINVI